MTVNSPPGRWLIQGGSITMIESKDVNIPQGLNVDSGTFYVDKTNNRVGIGMTGPTKLLDVNGATRFSGASSIVGVLTVGTSSSIGQIGLGTGTQAKLITGASFFRIQNWIPSISDYRDVFYADAIGNVGIETTSPRQRLEVGSPSAIAISGDGHVLAGTDVAGQVTISAGGSAVVQTFGTAYAVSPYVQLTPTSALIGSDWWASSSAGSFVANVTPVGAETIFNYFVIGSIQ